MPEPSHFNVAGALDTDHGVRLALVGDVVRLQLMGGVEVGQSPLAQIGAEVSFGPIIEGYRPRINRAPIDTATALQASPGDGHARADSALFPDLTDGKREELVDAKTGIDPENDQRLVAEGEMRQRVVNLEFLMFENG